jgi:hypothetical protein
MCRGRRVLAWEQRGGGALSYARQSFRHSLEVYVQMYADLLPKQARDKRNETLEQKERGRFLPEEFREGGHVALTRADGASLAQPV